MKGVSTWTMAAGILKLATLVIIVAMFAKIGWDLLQDRKADPSPFHWLLLVLVVLQVAAWGIGILRGSRAS